MDYFTLSPDMIEKQGRMLAEQPELLKEARAVVYAMIGGGFLGRTAICWPQEFYIDSRVDRLPYSRRAILQAVKILAVAHRSLGLHEYHEEARLGVPNMGVL
jgi:hypothetical protein